MTITEQLAAALRRLDDEAQPHPDCDEQEREDFQAARDAAREALARYDAAQLDKGEVKSNREWREECQELRAQLRAKQAECRHANLNLELDRAGGTMSCTDCGASEKHSG